MNSLSNREYCKSDCFVDKGNGVGILNRLSNNWLDSLSNKLFQRSDSPKYIANYGPGNITLSGTLL